MTQTLDEFVVHFMRIGRSPETIRKYRKDLRQFFTWSHVRHVSEIDRERIAAWVTEMRERSYSDGSIANHLWAIRAFLKFLCDEKGVACSEFNFPIPRMKAPEVVEYLESSEIEALFSNLDLSKPDDLRLRAFIEVMINTGMRPSECLNRDRKDMLVAEIEIVGKGKKRRKVYVNDRARYWAGLYLASRSDDNEALFVTPRGRMSLRQIEHQFLQLVRRSGIGRKIVLHTLRHTYGTTLLFNGCPLPYVSALLGHSKTETTLRHYLAIRQKHAKVAHFKYLNYEEGCGKPCGYPGDYPVSEMGTSAERLSPV